MSKVNNLRKLDISKLKEDLGKKQSELVDKKLMLSVGKEKNLSVFRNMRKEISRIKTIMNEMEVLNER